MRYLNNHRDRMDRIPKRTGFVKQSVKNERRNSGFSQILDRIERQRSKAARPLREGTASLLCAGGNKMKEGEMQIIL